jgi:hypothetical protein
MNKRVIKRVNKSEKSVQLHEKADWLAIRIFFIYIFLRSSISFNAFWKMAGSIEYFLVLALTSYLLINKRQ